MLTLRTFLAAIVALVVTSSPDGAQTPDAELGCPGELRGVLMVYVDAEVGEVLRARVIDELGEKLPGLIFVAAEGEAEVRLRLSFEGVPGSPYGRSTGAVIRRGGTGQERLLLRVANVRRVGRGEQARSFAARFVKEYREAHAATGAPDCPGTGS